MRAFREWLRYWLSSSTNGRTKQAGHDAEVVIDLQVTTENLKVIADDMKATADKMEAQVQRLMKRGRADASGTSPTRKRKTKDRPNA